MAARGPGVPVIEAVSKWARAEPHHQDEVGKATVGRRADDGTRTDFARLRQAAIANDVELWALERRHVRRLTDLVSTAIAAELGVAPDALEARIAGEATAVALMEANARAAQGDSAFAESLAFVVAFIQGGVAAARK